jgi:hypothetical protein
MHRFTTSLLRSALVLSAAVLALSAFGGCSLFYDLNATQCQATSDCLALGPQFAGTTCVNRVCQLPISNAGSGGGGDAGESGTGGSGESSTMGGKGSGGKGSGGKSGGGSGGSAGTGGTGSTPECTTNADCITANVDQPYICKNSACIKLISTSCPVLLPTSNALTLLKTGDPIILGGYANMTNTANPHDSLAVINWDLAFDEFNSALQNNGIPNGSNPSHPVLDLVCQGTDSDITPSLAHLTQDIGTPGILTTLSADKLFTAFNVTQSAAYTNAGGNPVFFMSTGSATLQLANLMDYGLMWHMLGDPRTLSATTVALLKRIEPYVNAQRKALCTSLGANCKDDPSKIPMRVTLVYNDQVTMSDMYTVLTTPDSNHPEVALSFNNASGSVTALGTTELAAVDQLASTGSGDFRTVMIQSAQTVPSGTTPAVQKAIDDLQNNPPHVILAIATSEFPKSVMPQVEMHWGDTGTPSEGMQKPFYIASQLLYNTVELQATAAANALNTRLVGVNYAEAQDTHSKTLYNTYENNLVNSYTGTLTLAGTENYYDGAYSLLYGLAAATLKDPDGSAIANVIGTRVLGTSGTSTDIGKLAITNGSVSTLVSQATYKISLWGTMGPPNFDYASGTRVSTTSAWCIQPGTSSWDYQADGLIYDPANQVFTDPTATKPACISMY